MKKLISIELQQQRMNRCYQILDKYFIDLILDCGKNLWEPFLKEIMNVEEDLRNEADLVMVRDRQQQGEMS